MAKSRRLSRALVIERAAAMADEAGNASSVSLSALADAFEIRPPSLYNHVASLEDLQRGIAVRAAQQLLVGLRQASQGRVGEEALMSMANAYRRYAGEHPGIYPLTVRAPGPDEAELVALAGELLQMLLLVMASMGLSGAEAIHAVRGLRAILHGFCSLEAAEGYKMPVSLDESFHRLVTTYVRGLKS